MNNLTKEPIEPEHKFEVTLEPDNFTEEKSGFVKTISYIKTDFGAGMLSTPITRGMYITSLLLRL